MRHCSVHHRRSQIATVSAMSITADSLLLKLKLDYDVGYDTAVKGASVVVNHLKSKGHGHLACAK
jgi:hypothetical protein